MRPWPIPFLIALLTVFAGCTDPPADAGDNETADPGDAVTVPPPPQDEAVAVQLSGAYPVNIAYAPASIEVGNNTNVTVTFTNTDQNPVASHDWVLEGVDGAATEVIANGASSDVTFLAPPPGDYMFYCSVPGHRGNGMEGTFIVTA